jgi:hypothetical protein
MKRKQILVCMLILLCLSLPLFSVDFGLNIGNVSDFSRNVQNVFSQTNSAVLWFTTPIKDFSFAASMVYKFNYTWTSQTGSYIKPYYFDIGTLEFSGFIPLPGNTPSSIRFDAGRIQADDIIGKIFSTKSDGLKVSWMINNITLGIQSYYTGLTLKSNSSLLLSPQDADDIYNEDVIFGPSRLVYSVYAVFQEFMLRQNASLEFLGQNDLRSGADPSVNTYYGSVVLSGPLFSTLRYSAGTSFGVLQSDNTSNFGQLITGNLSLRIPSKGTSLTLSGLYTLPWGGGNTAGFVPVNEQSVSIVLPELKHNMVTYIGFETSTQRSSVFSNGIKLSSYLNKSIDRFALPVLDVSKPNLFVGGELSAYGNFVVSSEFSFMYSAGLFVFNPFSVIKGVNIIPFRVSLSATLKI